MNVDVVGAVGLAIGLIGLASTILGGLVQTSQTKIQLRQLANYMEDMDSRLLYRFDRLEETISNSPSRNEDANA